MFRLELLGEEEACSGTTKNGGDPNGTMIIDKVLVVAFLESRYWLFQG